MGKKIKVKVAVNNPDGTVSLVDYKDPTKPSKKVKSAMRKSVSSQNRKKRTKKARTKAKRKAK